MSDFERIRLVLLGGAGVGKSCVVRRFLMKSYCDKYRPTVEDLHNREYDLGSVTLKVRVQKIIKKKSPGNLIKTFHSRPPPPLILNLLSWNGCV